MSTEQENYSPQLIVCDDDPVIRELLQTAFNSKSYELKLFENGQQVIDACKNSLPDLVVSDIKMPGISGYEVCKWIKENTLPNFIPVVLLTSMNEIEDTVSGFNCGADEYITKPFAFPELTARVDALLRIKFLTDKLKKTQDLLAEKEQSASRYEHCWRRCPRAWSTSNLDKFKLQTASLHRPNKR